MGKRNAVVSISVPAQLQGSSLGDTLCVSSSLHFQPVPSPWWGRRLDLTHLSAHSQVGSKPSVQSSAGKLQR